MGGRNKPAEIAILVLALLLLVAAQLLLSSAVPGSTYRGPDGAMVQANVFTALKFGGLFNVTNINPMQGLGSQLLPKNPWANPAFWPFAVFARETAADVSSAVALTVYALACYVMLRCFDLPVLVSVIASQCCIVLFAPTLFFVDAPRNFSATPADAVCYAPYLVALGLLVRIQPGHWRQFVAITAGIAACLLYSVYCDPAFGMIPAISWSVAFAAVVLCPLRAESIALRGLSLACCLGALVVSGAAAYLYTLSRYSARIQFAQTVDRDHIVDYATVFFRSGYLPYFYAAFAAGLICGLLFAKGRPKALVMAAVLSWLFYLGYTAVFLVLVGAPWVLPMPLYVEQSLFVLLMAGAFAGAWTLVQRIGSQVPWSAAADAFVRTRLTRSGESNDAGQSPRNRLFRSRGTMAAVVIPVALVAVVPALVAVPAIQKRQPFPVSTYWPWADEPELVQFLTERMALTVGGPFRGYVNILTGSTDGTINDLWSRGVPTVNEYSQTASAPSLYFLFQFMKRTRPGLLNYFEFFWRDVQFPENYWAMAQLLGVRYAVERWPLSKDFNPGLPLITFPYHVPKQPEPEEPGLWYVYELPRPNLGDYSPTEVTVAASASETMAALMRPGFDYAKQVVLTDPVDKQLVPARSVRLSVIRNGLHLTGHSDGTSLVVLPQQFSHCLRARSRDVRVVRADLMLTGVVFSGDVDTDISFEYGIFTPWCRFADLADIKSLDMRIDVRRAHLRTDRLFAPWPEALERFKVAFGYMWR